jgi:hypothetical protein
MEFKLRDLALLLPDEVGDAESLRYTKDATAIEAPAQMLQPRIDPTKKVVIYRAGQVSVQFNDSLSLMMLCKLLSLGLFTYSTQAGVFILA